MKVSNLSPIGLTRLLEQEGLNLRIGPFTIRLRSQIRKVAENIRLLYAHYPIHNNSAFVDFHISLAQPKNLRRWVRPQVLFFFDGLSPFRPLPLDQAFSLFEWGLNWCVAKCANQHLIVHAAVVERGGHAIIMAAPPGSGKSTLCAGLVAHGWRLLSDELALISLEEGRLTPIPRPVSLKNHSIDVMRNFSSEITIGPETADTTKGVVAYMKAPDESVERADERARLAWIVCPKYLKGVPSQLEKRSKAQTFLHIVKNAFNYNLHGLKGFRTVASLVDTCHCYDFTYNSLDEAVRLFDKLEPQQDLAR